MIYITTLQHRKPRQITWEDVIADKLTLNDFALDNSNSSGTITRKYESIEKTILDKINVNEMIKWLSLFNQENEELFNIFFGQDKAMIEWLKEDSSFLTEKEG